MQKLLTFFSAKTISIYAIFNDQSFNDTLINDIVSFEHLGPDKYAYLRQTSEYLQQNTVEYLSYVIIFLMSCLNEKNC